jgi:hypothetical protein
MCSDSSGYGNDVQTGKSMLQRFGRKLGNIDLPETNSIISIFGYDKQNGSGATCMSTNGSVNFSKFSSLYSCSIKVGEGGDNDFFMNKLDKYNSTFFYRMK